MRRTLTALLLLVAIVFVSARVNAQANTAYLIQQLKTSDDYRVRVQAAIALGASGDAAAVQPLCDAIGDSNVNVKLISAAALGKLGNPRAVACLKIAQSRESAPAVKAQIDKSIAMLQGGGGGGLSAGTKYYVAIQITNKTSRSAPEIETIVRGAMQAKLGSTAGYAVAPKSETPAQGGEIIKGKNIKGFLLLATVEAPVYAGGSLTQIVNVGMFSYPDKSLKANSPVKFSQEDTPKKDVESENVLLKMCSEKAVADFQKVINTL